MLVLNSTTKSLQIHLAAAGTLPWSASWDDITTTTFVPGELDGYTAGVVPVTLVAAPAASAQRVLKSASVLNNSGSPATVTIRLNNNSVLYRIAVVTLANGDSLQFTDSDGWRTLDSTGKIKATNTAKYNAGIAAELAILGPYCASVNNLPASLTINGNACTPELRYKLGDAVATQLTPWTYGNTLPVVGSVGLTLNNGSPLRRTGWVQAADDSIYGTGSENQKYYQDSAATLGDCGSGIDFMIEILYKAVDDSVYNEPIEKFLTTSGWLIDIKNSLLRLLVYKDASNSASIQITSMDTTKFHFYHFFFDASDTGTATKIAFYVDGIKRSGTVTISGTCDNLTTTAKLSIGARSDGSYAIKGNLYYVCMYKGSGIFPGGAANITEWDRLSLLRVNQLLAGASILGA